MNVNSKLFGYQIIANGVTLFKRCIKSKHFLKVPEAIAVDEKTLNKAVEEGTKYVQIFEKEEKVYYSATVEQFRKKAISIDRGYGRQLALPLDYWITSKSKEIPQELTVEKQPLPLIFPIRGEKPQAGDNRQLSLFGEVIWTT
jgi:hypothetical protein